MIDQRLLPHAFETVRLATLDDAATAIREMWVRGAPLIGATGAYGLCLALREDASDASLTSACAALVATRPTGANLAWAVERMRRVLADTAPGERVERAWALADEIADEDVRICEAIGEHGLELLRRHADDATEMRPLHVLTHCNAGWLATVDWGTALAPIYKAHDAGIPVHVWVDETRPRGQGAALTAWELLSHGVRHTVIVDSAGGFLMQRGLVDLVITGADRVTRSGDVFNKIGTYPKALAARDNDVPFYVAVPSPTIDWTVDDPADVPIEERGGHEVARVTGRADDGTVTTVTVTPTGSSVANPAFDHTPARLVTGLVTERGVCSASAEGLTALFPEQGGAGP